MKRNSLMAVTDGIAVRIGTAIGSIMLGYGIHADHVNILVPAIILVGGFGIDLAVGKVVQAWQNRRH